MTTVKLVFLFVRVRICYARASYSLYPSSPELREWYSIGHRGEEEKNLINLY